MSWAFQVRVRLQAVSLFSLLCRVKRETRKWRRAWLMARNGRGCRPRSRVSLLRCSRARALLSLNLKKKRDCSQSKYVSTWDYIYISYLKWNFMKIPHWKKKSMSNKFHLPLSKFLMKWAFWRKDYQHYCIKSKNVCIFQSHLHNATNQICLCSYRSLSSSHMVAVL